MNPAPPSPGNARYPRFVDRHLGSTPTEIEQLLAAIECPSLDDLVHSTLPEALLGQMALELPPAKSESDALEALRALAERNSVCRNFIGMGYHGCIVPAVIQRNILENPGWYTQYTPYQSEISQGRLEALLNFQTLVSDLCKLPLANASLLDEATAAAEAMTMCRNLARGKQSGFFASSDCHPQTLGVLGTRAASSGVGLRVGAIDEIDFSAQKLCGVIVQYPTTDGRVLDYSDLAARAHDSGALLVMAADPLALTLLRAPGEIGADIAVGSTQRLGVPMGFGGPHAAYIAARESYRRQLPGRLVGVSRDALGQTAFRLALQTREQHIRRDKATSNICTAQVLLAIMTSMYAVYHGPEGLRAIGERVHRLTRLLAAGLRNLGLDCGAAPFFDTLKIKLTAEQRTAVLAAAGARHINLRLYEDSALGVSLDETHAEQDILELLDVFSQRTGTAADGSGSRSRAADAALEAQVERPGPLAALHARTSDYLTHPTFNSYRTEHELLRYMHRLQGGDLSLTTSMIPLGSCTMKLNATAEMLPVSWPEFANMHPFAPAQQSRGYARLLEDLERWLTAITGMPAVSLQPNAGSQGEYAGLLAIRTYHLSRGEGRRNVCLIPTSAHGTNPASAVIAGYRVVAVQCDSSGNIDIDDLRHKSEAHERDLGALMITYPSTHGVFEEGIKEICSIVHAAGGQVYLDGANLNALVGLCTPATIGADVCHLNLHKTFCIPHGGGGPGMGPIAAASHLSRFLPGHPLTRTSEANAVGPVAAAPYGSPGILPIPWMYIAMMGADGLTKATQVAILNANYMVQRLKSHYDILYVGKNGRVAHEFVLDARPFKASAGIEVEDIAKRLIDFGFHAPTMSWPVAGTLMVEPTESESKAELDRFCDAMIAIRAEIRAIERGELDRTNNPLKNAPHPALALASDHWDHPYSREQAAYPLAWLKQRKFWPSVARVDNAYGDRHLACTCPPVTSVAEGER